MNLLTTILMAGLTASGDPSLFVSGKPQLGRTLAFEVQAEAGDDVWLLVDVAPGPVVTGGVTFGVGFTSALLPLPLGTSTGAPIDVAVTVPDLPALDGLALWVEAAVPAPLAASGATALTLAVPLPLDSVDDYTYRLQGANGADLTLSEIAASAFDLCIVDFSRNGTSEFGPADVASLRGPAEPDRVRLAYMSIGEAEDYRWYWDLISPSLVAASNPQWPGNFKVSYWEPEWKEVILHGNVAVGKSYLDRVIDQGFDGVYLDIVDAFEFFGPAAEGGADLDRAAARKMVDFIVELAHHARITRGRSDFLVVPQNGANIIEAAWYPVDTLRPFDPPTPAAMAAKQRERLFRTIDAIGVEDVFFYGPKNKNNPFNPQAELLQILESWTDAGIPVLATEYLTHQNKVDKLYDVEAPAEGFVPYATVRNLDKLSINAGHEPD